MPRFFVCLLLPAFALACSGDEPEPVEPPLVKIGSSLGERGTSVLGVPAQDFDFACSTAFDRSQCVN